MSGGGFRNARKQAYSDRLKSYLDNYRSIVVVGADNVGSTQMQKIRQALRGSAELLMGKNTLMKKVLREYGESNPSVEPLIGLAKNNVGFVFTNGDVSEVEKKLSVQKVGVAAKAGVIAPNDVIVPKGPTGLEPTQTSFLHVLNVGSKINRGQIEILNDVHLIKAGQRVGSSEASLLQRLNIKPFAYGLSLLYIYEDGYVRLPQPTRTTDTDFLSAFRGGIDNVASLSLSIGYPSLASLPYALGAAFKNVLSVAVSTAYSFPAADQVKSLALAHRQVEGRKDMVVEKVVDVDVDVDVDTDDEIGDLFGSDD